MSEQSELLLLLKELVDKVENLEKAVYDKDNLLMKSGLVVVDTPTETIITGTETVSNGDWSTVYQGGGQEKRTVTTTTPKSKRIVTTRCTTPRTTLLNGDTHRLIRRRETVEDIFTGCDV